MASIYSITRLREHVYELALAFKVVVHELPEEKLPPVGPCALTQGRFGGVNSIYVPLITNEANYITALHELGHCIHPTGSVRTKDNKENYSLKLLEENSAWEWAEKHALDLTVEMESVKRACMPGYEEAARWYEEFYKLLPEELRKLFFSDLSGGEIFEVPFKPVQPQVRKRNSESMDDFLKRTKK